MWMHVCFFVLDDYLEELTNYHRTGAATGVMTTACLNDEPGNGFKLADRHSEMLESSNDVAELPERIPVWY
jgi:hypothetical protein